MYLRRSKKKEIISQDLDVFRSPSPHGNKYIYSILLDESLLNSNSIYIFERDFIIVKDEFLCYNRTKFPPLGGIVVEKEFLESYLHRFCRSLLDIFSSCVVRSLNLWINNSCHSKIHSSKILEYHALCSSWFACFVIMGQITPPRSTCSNSSNNLINYCLSKCEHVTMVVAEDLASVRR